MDRHYRPRGTALAAAMVLTSASSLVAVVSAVAADASAPSRPYEITESRQPCAEYEPLRRPFFGDLHVHTSFSQDASTQGTRNTPRDAYRFARGQRLGVQPYNGEGKAMRSLVLDRPLDFVAVTDHAEMLGETRICQTPEFEGYGSIVCRIYRRWPRAAFFLMNMRAAGASDPERYGFCGPDGINCAEAAATPWGEIRNAAEGAYDRTSACSFTTFVGYEWTAAPSGNNLHRNVIFRNDRVTPLPISYFEASTAQALWRALTAECISAGEGCDVLTIPHNSNLSGGQMFLTERPDGSALGEDDARQRASFEPLVEIMQHKGDSECLLGPETTDELCAFEKLPYTNFAGRYFSILTEAPHPQSFVREALKQGLAVEARIGANPFRFGVVGGTDTHLGTPGAADEDRFLGHGGAGKSAKSAVPAGLPDNLEYNPGGLSVVWAEENTRDSLFAAMRRREAYGTSGTRIVVRLFAGWNLAADLCDSRDFVAAGYRHGVPMGAVLPPPSSPADGSAPSLAVWALQDPGARSRPGTPLERIQVIKGWLDADSDTHEAVYDVAVASGEAPRVDARSCETNGAGAAELCTVWTDPDFDPARPAFYYVRVLEAPTCRWSARVCNAHAVDCEQATTIGEGFEPCCSDDHRRTIRERAWTSAVWYSPEAAPR